MRSGSTVDEDEQTLEEIRNVGSLVVDMLGDANHRRDRFLDDRSNQLQRVVRATSSSSSGLL